MSGAPLFTLVIFMKVDNVCVKFCFFNLFPRTCSASGVKGLVVVSIYIYIYVCGRKKYLNRTLVDSPFQTFAVGLLVKFID